MITIMSLYILSSIVKLMKEEQFIMKMTRTLHKIIHKLEDSMQSQNNFVSSMSHEMRNPLNSTLGSIYILKNAADLDEEKQNLIDRATASGEMLLSQINNILDAGKIRADQLEICLRKTQVRREVWKVVQANISNFQSSQNPFEVKIDPEVPKWLYVDPTKFD